VRQARTLSVYVIIMVVNKSHCRKVSGFQSQRMARIFRKFVRGSHRGSAFSLIGLFIDTAIFSLIRKTVALIDFREIHLANLNDLRPNFPRAFSSEISLDQSLSTPSSSASSRPGFSRLFLSARFSHPFPGRRGPRKDGSCRSTYLESSLDFLLTTTCYAPPDMERPIRSHVKIERRVIPRYAITTSDREKRASRNSRNNLP